MHGTLLTLHVASGALGLVIGLLAMSTPKRSGWHPRLGVSYQIVVAVLTASSLGLVALAPARLWWLALVAIATELAALGGWLVRRRHQPGWRAMHVRLMCGSYVSLVTAALVVNWTNPVAWVVPTIVATPLIGIASRSVKVRDAAADVAT